MYGLCISCLAHFPTGLMQTSFAASLNNYKDFWTKARELCSYFHSVRRKQSDEADRAVSYRTGANCRVLNMLQILKQPVNLITKYKFNNILQTILLQHCWSVIQLIPKQALPGKQLQVSGRTTSSEDTVWGSVCMCVCVCTPGHVTVILVNTREDHLSHSVLWAIFMFHFFKKKKKKQQQRCFSQKPSAQVHWVLAKERSCSEQHVSNEVTFTLDRGLTSSPSMNPPPLSPGLWQGNKNIRLTGTADVTVY